MTFSVQIANNTSPNMETFANANCFYRFTYAVDIVGKYYNNKHLRNIYIYIFFNVFFEISNRREHNIARALPALKSLPIHIDYNKDIIITIPIYDVLF